MTQPISSILLRVERIKVLRDLGFLSRKDDNTVFDQMTQLASTIIGAPVSLVSMVAADYQFFKSQVGLPEPWASNRQTPLSHSFCQHVVATNTPLVVTDAREVDFLKDNRAIPDLDVIGYLGMPLTLSDGTSLGSFCVIDSQPREWQQIEIDIMTELGQIVTRDIDLRAMANLDAAHKQRLAQYEAGIQTLLETLNMQQTKPAFLDKLRHLRGELRL